MNVIINVIVVSDERIVVRMVLGWVVVLSLGLLGCWGGDKTYFGGIVCLCVLSFS